MAASKPKLIYFSSRGLAEPIRIILAESNTDYDNVGFGVFVEGKPPAMLLELKANGSLDFDQVPLWQEPNGFSLVQSSTIVRYLARQKGLTGKDEHEAARADSFWEYYKDINTSVSTVARNPDPVKKEELKKKLLEEDLPKHLARLEGLLKKNNTGFLVGKDITYADLAIWYLLDNGIDQEFFTLEKYEHLQKFKKSIDSRPNIHKYLTDPKRYPVQYAFPRYFMHTYDNSTNVYKSQIAAEYGGIKIVCTKNFKFGVDNKTPEFLQKNPNGQVPLLESPDGPIWESNAIARYVARKGTDKGLLGSNEYESSLVDEWIEWIRSNEKSFSQWAYPVFGWAEFNQSTYDSAKSGSANALKVLNVHLDGREWIVAKRVSLADIILFSALYSPFRHLTDPEFIKPYPHVVAWANRCYSQPQFKKVIGEFAFADREKKTGELKEDD